MNSKITYSSNGHTKSPAEIEQEIQFTRQRMESTIQAIKRDLSPGQMVDQALHYFREGKVGDVVGSAASSVGGVVKQNPLPMAVVGAGLVWLAYNNYQRRHPGEVSSSISSSSYGTGEEFVSTAPSSTFEPVEEKHSRMEGAKERMRGMKESAKTRGVAVKERASSLSHGAAERARSLANTSRSTALRAKGSAQHQFDENPLVVGAIAIGVGALLGALLPSTSRENRLMGGKRDELMRKADEKGAEVLGRAREKVDEGVQKVKAGLDQRAGIVEGAQLEESEAPLAETTGGMSGSTAYGTSSVNPIVETTETTVATTSVQATSPAFPAGSSSGLVEGGPLPDIDPSKRGPGY